LPVKKLTRTRDNRVYLSGIWPVPPAFPVNFAGTEAAIHRRMKDNSFAMAMEKIVGQAEAEQQHEIHVQKRAEVIGRVRSVFVFLLVATVFVFAFCYREQIQNAIFPKPSAQQQSGGQTSAALNAAKQNAAARDSVIDSITK
jgi:hypothetical protein